MTVICIRYMRRYNDRVCHNRRRQSTVHSDSRIVLDAYSWTAAIARIRAGIRFFRAKRTEQRRMRANERERERESFCRPALKKIREGTRALVTFDSRRIISVRDSLTRRGDLLFKAEN